MTFSPLVTQFCNHHYRHRRRHLQQQQQHCVVINFWIALVSLMQLRSQMPVQSSSAPASHHPISSPSSQASPPQAFHSGPPQPHFSPAHTPSLSAAITLT
jgi:hypothetical protein